MRFIVGGPRIGGLRTGVILGKKDFQRDRTNPARKDGLRALGLILLIAAAGGAYLMGTYMPADIASSAVIGWLIGVLICWWMAKVIA